MTSSLRQDLSNQPLHTFLPIFQTVKLGMGHCGAMFSGQIGRVLFAKGLPPACKPPLLPHVFRRDLMANLPQAREYIE